MVVCVDKKFQSYYTHSSYIVNYMIDLLEPQDGLDYLEPAAGDGVFIDPLLNYKDITIDAFDINPDSIQILNEKFRENSFVNVEKKDTLTETHSDLFSSSLSLYDRIIANPPYGAWQDYEKRNLLKEYYPGYYVKETYALFLKRAIQLLKDEGVLVFIIPDTFLNLHMHTKLRKFILDNTKIVNISLFPSSFFPNVNFGYSNLCIVKLVKCADKYIRDNNIISIYNNFSTVDQLNCENIADVKILQKDMKDNIDHALFISKDDQLTLMINKSERKIADIADCVTGFYSGNDKMFLKVISKDIRGAKKYELANENNIFMSSDVPLAGVEGDGYLVPIMKGGNHSYYKPTNWFMNWQKETVEFYKKDKKARFQNSQYYFKDGVGVPMVSSSKITGALIENRLFDQSIVGIFPHDEEYLFYLLAFFNSEICNSLIRTINPSANNSANYIKKIPIVQPKAHQLDYVTTLSKEIYSLHKKNKPSLALEAELDKYFCDIYVCDI